MRLRLSGIVALTFMLGCVRFGYKAHRGPTDQPPESRDNDAGMAGRMDATVADADAGSQEDASAMDASMAADSASDAASPPADAGGLLDASAPDDAGAPNDGAMEVSMDDDSGPTATDAGSSNMGPCAVTVTTNGYVGSPHYHGTLALQNAGSATWTTPTIRFDLPSSGYICNDTAMLPGAGWLLSSSSGQCTYTRTAPSLSIAPGATLTFEYSSNNSSSVQASAAANVSVSGCP